jgi:spore coat polysaccharide biosynthesis protein SpsF
MENKVFKTEQEEFWSGTFGNEYISRNQSSEYLASNLNFFSKALNRVSKPASLIEFGANIGMNLKAIGALYPSITLKGIEINALAASELKELIGEDNVIEDSIFNVEFRETCEVSIIKGVLIHINPEMLQTVYEKLYQASSKYILVCEYYNPSPVTIPYRGNNDRLFKRDFAGEILDKYSDLKLIDYGFSYRRDPSFPQDDITWFLLEKI